jgi:hypothetical protein
MFQDLGIILISRSLVTVPRGHGVSLIFREPCSGRHFDAQIFDRQAHGLVSAD